MNNDSFINSVNLNQETSFPYLVLDVVNDESYPRNPGFRVMHWHEDLQFIYVLDGSIKVRTLQETVVVKKAKACSSTRTLRIWWIERALAITTASYSPIGF